MDVDEGYSDEALPPVASNNWEITVSVQDTAVLAAPVDISGLTQAQKGALALHLVSTLDFEQLSLLHRHVAPLLHIDIVGRLPTEIALYVLSFLPVGSLVCASYVNHRWNSLTQVQLLWKGLCLERNWLWKQPAIPKAAEYYDVQPPDPAVDEGFNDDDVETRSAHEITPMHTRLGSAIGFAAFKFSLAAKEYAESSRNHRHSAPAGIASNSLCSNRPDWKLLYATRTILKKRLRSGNYRLTVLQAPSQRASAPAAVGQHQNLHAFLENGNILEPPTPAGHTSTIYALCLGTDPTTGEPAVFTGSRDQTILQWSLARLPFFNTNTEDFPSWRSSLSGKFTDTSSVPCRIFEGAHAGSVLSVYVLPSLGYLVSGGSDGRIVIWDIRTGLAVKTIAELDGHEDTVLCVRADEKRLVTSSKDTTVRTFRLPSMQPHLVLRSHRAAVNALAISEGLIASASGDRSLRIWDAETGDLLRVYESHHGRGLASVDFCFPFIATGSSDRQIRYFNLASARGWTTEAVSRNATQNPAQPRIQALIQQHNDAEPQGGGAPAFDANEFGDIEHVPPTPAFNAVHQQQQQQQQNVYHQIPVVHGNMGAQPWMASPTPARHTARALIRWKELVSAAAFNASAFAKATSNVSPACTCGHAQMVAREEPLCITCGGLGHLPRLHSQTLVNQPTIRQGMGVPSSSSSSPLSQRGHRDLVRAVAISEDANVIVSGSYDTSLKVWDRTTGRLLADLADGHAGRVFGIAMDCTKIVSCGEDERICIWDFAWDLDTAFVEL